MMMDAVSDLIFCTYIASSINTIMKVICTRVGFGHGTKSTDELVALGVYSVFVGLVFQLCSPSNVCV